MFARFACAILGVVGSIGCSSPSSSGPAPELVDLRSGIRAFSAAFGEQSTRTKFLAILSPT